MHGTLSVTPYQFLLHYLILFPMQTSRSSHNLSQLSILYASTPTIPVWSTYPHFPTPHSTQHITQLFLVQFFFHLYFCAFDLRLRIVLWYTSEQRLSCPNFQLIIFSD